MKQLPALVEKIMSDRCAAMTVINLSDNNPKTNVVYANASAVKVVKDYKSFENFFETLYKNGLAKLRIFERRANGTSYLPFGEPFDFDLATQTESASTFANESPAEKTAEEQPQMTAQDPNFPGLSGPGLNAAELYHYSKDHARLSGENLHYKSENETLKKKVSKLKKQIILHNQSEAKLNGQNDVMKTVVEREREIMAGLALIGI